MITENYQVLTPAYGRDYTTAKAAKSDFEAGKDFFLNSVTHGFTYCSKSDFAKGVTVNIRYKQNTQVTSVKVK